MRRKLVSYREGTLWGSLPAYHAKELLAFALLHQRRLVAQRHIHTGLAVVHGIAGVTPKLVHPLNGRRCAMYESAAG